MFRLEWKIASVLTAVLTATACASTCLLSPKLDVAIIYDGSESMARNPSLPHVKKYISKIIELLDVQTDPSKGTRVGAWAYTFQHYTQIDFIACRSQEHALRAVERLRELAPAGLLVSDMFAFIAGRLYTPTFGARSTDASVTKVAIILLDSPVSFAVKPPAEIRSSLQAAKIETYAVVIEDRGLKASAIQPYLPNPLSTPFAVPNKPSLMSFDGLHEALKKRYGCSKCSPNPCKNGGTCSKSSSAPFYQCQCPTGWTGTNCDVEDSCTLCYQNGGTSCIKSGGTVSSCTCPPGKIGTYCHLPDPCHPPPGPCKNGASCTSDPNVLNGYSCKCVGSFIGKNCQDSKIANPCLSANCNGYPCVPAPNGLHTCNCPPICKTPPDCSACAKQSPCAANPCKNNCICRLSASHEGGFVCYSPAGQLGRLCDIPKAEITCGPTHIVVKVPQELVREYERGTPGAIVYISPTTKNLHNCVAAYKPAEKKYVLRYPTPFTSCGTMKTAVTGGSEFENKVWLNRVSATIDMPVPVTGFKCIYSNTQTVVSTSLRPTLRSLAPIITNVGAFNVSLDAFKQAPGKPDEQRGPLTSGSVYIVGEEVYLTATLRSRPSNPPTGPLVVKLLACYAAPTPSSVNKVDLVVNSCPVTAMNVKMVENAVGESATIQLRTFKLGTAPYVFYSCQIDVCSKNAPTCRPATNCVAGRRRRDSNSSRYPVDLAKRQNTLSTGPIIVLTEAERDAIKGLIGKHDRVFIEQQVIEPQEGEDADVATSRNIQLIVVTAANFLFLVVLCLIFLVLYIRHQNQK